MGHNGQTSRPNGMRGQPRMACVSDEQIGRSIPVEICPDHSVGERHGGKGSKQVLLKQDCHVSLALPSVRIAHGQLEDRLRRL